MRFSPLVLAVTLLWAALLPGCHRTQSESITEVELKTPDGLRLSGRLFVPHRKHPPSLILVHRLGASGEDWYPFAERAQQSGYMSIAIDLRGHGNSRAQTDGFLDYRAFTDAIWSEALQDIEAARARLLDAGADPENMFIAGEAIGASLALQYAVDHDDIQGVILVSPGLDYKGMDAAELIQRFTRRPCLLLWSEGDAYAAGAADTLQRLAPGNTEVHAYQGAAHGTDLFDVSPQANGQVMVWLDQMLALPAGVPAPDSAPESQKS